MNPATIDYHLGQSITAFSTLRCTSNPSDPYSGFNTCHYTDDSPAHVDECRRTLALMLPEVSKFVFPRQTHSLNVEITDGSISHPENVDALVTTSPGVALCIHTADCVPLLLADEEEGIIGAAHSGWRGTLGRIAARTVECMVQLGASPERIKAAMGPSICSGCFEVGEEVALQFRREGLDNSVIEHAGARPHISLPHAIIQTLEEAGITQANISLPPICSHCHPYELCSARYSGINSARTLSLIFRVA